MERSTIRIVIILATLSVLGIILMQFFFLMRTVDNNERKFHESASSALKNVAQNLIDYNIKVKGHSSNIDISRCVDQISNNYYVVNINDDIDPTLLGHFLTIEFDKLGLDVEFEYAIYDCESNQMVYASEMENEDDINYEEEPSDDESTCTSEDFFFDKHFQQTTNQDIDSNMPVCDKYTHYFGVTFPERSKYYSNQISAWYWINGFLILVILFFGYTLYVIFKQRRLSEIQKNFINNLTHEFKTPIAAINLSSKVLSDPKIIDHPKRLQEYSRIIGEQSQRLSSQVEKVLQMTNIQKQRIQLDKEEINLKEFLLKTISDFKASLDGNDYQIEVNANDDQVFTIADKLHFSNIIFNILDNAFKYCDDIPYVKIDIIQTKKEIELRFADNGIGIPKEFRKKIFNSFFRIPTGDVHNVKGFGLGLDYVMKIVKRHEWEIEVSDNYPKGSIFIIKIPD